MTYSHGHLRWLLAMLVCAGCHDSDGGSGSAGTTIHGSGNVVEERRSVSGFISVEHATQGSLYIEPLVAPLSPDPHTSRSRSADGSLHVTVRLPGPAEKAGEMLLVRAEDNLLPYLTSTVQGGALLLRTTPNVTLMPTKPIEFFLTVTDLEAVKFNGVGSIEVSGLTTDELSVTCTGVGNVLLSDLDALELTLAIGGIVQVSAWGHVDHQRVTLDGFDDYLAGDLYSQQAEVFAHSMGSATVRVSDLLVATIASSGSVYYYGDPTVNATITGSGQLVNLGP